jgi:hypothetical protein
MLGIVKIACDFAEHTRYNDLAAGDPRLRANCATKGAVVPIGAALRVWEVAIGGIRTFVAHRAVWGLLKLGDGLPRSFERALGRRPGPG